MNKLEGQFSGTGQSNEIDLFSHFNIELVFSSTGSISVQRKLDGSSSWRTVEVITANVSKIGYEPEHNVKYRLDCTAVSGTIDYRLSR